MKMLAISDTHAKRLEDLPEKVLRLIDKADVVVHAGDFTTLKLYEELKNVCELKAVYGNSDEDELKKILPKELVFEVEGVKFGVVHQGNYLNEFHDLGYKAKELGVNVLIFGHIHRFVLQEFKDVVVLCPGSPTSPRLSASSCALIEVKGGKIDVEFVLASELACGIDVRLKT